MRAQFRADFPLTKITIGTRYRHELGDLDALCASIQERGLLVPITVTTAGVLVFGARRLAATQKLGHTTINAWVVDGISDQLGILLAMKDDVELHLALKPTEQAHLYEELRELSRAAARRRQEASRFGAADSRGKIGRADSAAPVEHGTSRRQAAHAVTGTAGYDRLEKILDVQRLADTGNEWLARQASAALVQIDATGKVNPSFLHIKTLEMKTDLTTISQNPTHPEKTRNQARRDLEKLEQIDHPQDAHRFARDALSRAKKTLSTDTPPSAALPERTSRLPESSGWDDIPAPIRTKHAAQSFLASCETMAAVWAEYAPPEVADAFTENDWHRFEEFSHYVSDFTTRMTGQKQTHTPRIRHARN